MIQLQPVETKSGLTKTLSLILGGLGVVFLVFFVTGLGESSWAFACMVVLWTLPQLGLRADRERVTKEQRLGVPEPTVLVSNKPIVMGDYLEIGYHQVFDTKIELCRITLELVYTPNLREVKLLCREYPGGKYDMGETLKLNWKVEIPGQFEMGQPMFHGGRTNTDRWGIWVRIEGENGKKFEQKYKLNVQRKAKL